VSESGRSVSDSELAPVKKAYGSIAAFGLVLALLGGIVMVITLIQSIWGIWHYASLPTYPAHPGGVSSDRQLTSIFIFTAGGLIGPLAAALLWFDWVGTRMSKQNRIVLIGYLGGPIAVMALVIVASVPRF
jgi:hypothetical protein